MRQVLLASRQFRRTRRQLRLHWNTINICIAARKKEQRRQHKEKTASSARQPQTWKDSTESIYSTPVK